MTPYPGTPWRWISALHNGMTTEDAESWCRTNCAGDWQLFMLDRRVLFADDQDASFFELRWR